MPRTRLTSLSSTQPTWQIPFVLLILTGGLVFGVLAIYWYKQQTHEAQSNLQAKLEQLNLLVEQQRQPSRASTQPPLLQTLDTLLLVRPETLLFDQISLSERTGLEIHGSIQNASDLTVLVADAESHGLKLVTQQVTQQPNLHLQFVLKQKSSGQQP